MEHEENKKMGTQILLEVCSESLSICAWNSLCGRCSSDTGNTSSLLLQQLLKS